MKRRKFIQSSIALTAVSMLPSLPSIAKETQKVIKPKRLKKGDTIGLISPGSFINEDQLEESIENVEKLGFKTKYSNRILNKLGYLGGSDQERAKDVNEMFADDEVDGIICARGGYGCSRMLPYLNYELIKKNPKVLMGYSDITSLLYGIYQKTGLVCFHGPVGISTFNEFTMKYLSPLVFDGVDNLMLKTERKDVEDPAYKLWTINKGKSIGQLVGGNLSIVVSLIGTEFDIDTEGKIIFLEEIGEEPYRIDRMLTQMIESGKFDKAAGLCLGIFRKCNPDEDDPDFEDSFTLREVLKDRLGNLDIPVNYGMAFGHVNDKFTLPFGIFAELNTQDNYLKILENAVV